VDHAGLRTQCRKTSDKRGSRPRTDVWDLVQHVGHVALPRGARCGKAARRDLRGGREEIPVPTATAPLLANVLLDEVDRELERRGHKFVRYADDCNVYVKSRRAGERVLQGLRGCYAKLALKVNEAKTAVAAVWGRKFLGYCFWAARQGEVRRAVAAQAMHGLRERIRQLTRRTRGRSLEQIAADLRGYVPGGKTYFRLAQTPNVMRELAAAPAARRAAQAVAGRDDDVPRAAGAGSQRGSGCARCRQCKTLVAQQPHGPEPGVARRVLRASWSPTILLTSTSRTARCGPACRVVWEGSDQR
jgi:hypothetical protein